MWQVWKVKDGLVNEWNKNQAPEMQAQGGGFSLLSSFPWCAQLWMQVKGGDAVVAVNGKRGSLPLK